MSENRFFRKFICGLSKEDTAKLCFKSVSTISKWDRGNPIPPECKRLMRIHRGYEIASIDNQWQGWRFNKGNLVNDQGISLSPQQILTGYALLEIGSEQDRRAQREIIKIARILRRVTRRNMDIG
ncbi:regulator [Photobacterium angustum]|nr:regulator [Photobacterium angustum]PSW92158.1 regulator [Photobacterium angustum]